MVDDIAAGRFKQQTGVAFSFTSIDGVGEKTARKVQASTGAEVPKEVADYNASTLANEANITESRARKIIREGGGNPDVDSRGTSRGSVGAGNLPLRQGDFLPNAMKHDKAEADHSRRGASSRRMDNRRRAPVTTDYETWSSNPDHFDYPGVDTPTDRPKVLPKDYKSGAEIRTTDPDEEREIATGTDAGEFFRRIEGKRRPASDIIDTGPDEGNFTAPGLAPEDFEEEYMDESMSISATYRPKGLAEGKAADMAFALSEEERKERQREQILDEMF